MARPLRSSRRLLHTRRDTRPCLRCATARASHAAAPLRVVVFVLCFSFRIRRPATDLRPPRRRASPSACSPRTLSEHHYANGCVSAHADERVRIRRGAEVVRTFGGPAVGRNAGCARGGRKGEMGAERVLAECGGARLCMWGAGAGAGEGEGERRRRAREDGVRGREREMHEEGEPRPHFGIFATRALRQGEEIVVGWEWYDANAVHRVGEVAGNGGSPILLTPTQRHLIAQPANILHARRGSGVCLRGDVERCIYFLCARAAAAYPLFPCKFRPRTRKVVGVGVGVLHEITYGAGKWETEEGEDVDVLGDVDNDKPPRSDCETRRRDRERDRVRDGKCERLQEAICPPKMRRRWKAGAAEVHAVPLSRAAGDRDGYLRCHTCPSTDGQREG
ncbi:hypothetical protein K438DRAFT_1870402 [Mycena galopus ATCC 62051]|nr:hypothetical protein K438DRAFT_1870402 [Mycena galopus ATCC 62051]